MVWVLVGQQNPVDPWAWPEEAQSMRFVISSCLGNRGTAIFLGLANRRRRERRAHVQNQPRATAGDLDASAADLARAAVNTDDHSMK